MVISVEWQDERGAVLARYDGQPLTAEDVWKAAPDSVCARFIDPYGNALFNYLQVERLEAELQALGADPALLAFVRQARGHRHTYLKFIGD